MQCKVPQSKLRVLQPEIKLKVLQPKLQVQGLAAQRPANNNAQVGQNVPMQPPQQLAPAQPVPAGLVVSALKYFIKIG